MHVFPQNFAYKQVPVQSCHQLVFSLLFQRPFQLTGVTDTFPLSVYEGELFILSSCVREKWVKIWFVPFHTFPYSALNYLLVSWPRSCNHPQTLFKMNGIAWNSLLLCLIFSYLKKKLFYCTLLFVYDTVHSMMYKVVPQCEKI